MEVIEKVFGLEDKVSEGKLHSDIFTIMEEIVHGKTNADFNTNSLINVGMMEIVRDRSVPFIMKVRLF